MRSLLKLIAATAAVCAAPAVQAQNNIFVDNPTNVPGAFFSVESDDIFDGPISATFGRAGIGMGEFTDNFLFTIPQTGLGSGSITTILAGLTGGATDLDFLNVTFSNGSGTFVVPTMTNFGFMESGGLANLPIMMNVQNTLSVTYLSRGQGSYGGNLTFAPAVSPIPEPATWAMMVLGFGAVGFVMRRRRQDTMRVSYA